MELRHGSIKKAMLVTLITLTILGGAPNRVWAWGRTGHQMVASVGSRLTQNGRDFWNANEANMEMLTLIPDALWKATATYAGEKGTHFFQPDSYYKNPADFVKIPHSYQDLIQQFTEPFVTQTGTATFRIVQLYNMAVTAFRSGDMARGLQLAGAMSHYIGDLSQPLHVTENYDGQMTGDAGIHKFFETTNIDDTGRSTVEAVVEKQALALLRDSQFVDEATGPLIDVVFREMERSYAFKDQVINLDLKEGRTGRGAADMVTLAEARLADGAATLTLILNRLWVEAGSPSAAAALTVSAPQWIKPDYSGALSHKSSLVDNFDEEEDCSL